MQTARFLRQVDILKPEKCNVPICIIGAGATGSFLALALAKMGMVNIRVWDADKIEEHNFPNQMYPIKTMGKLKVEALYDVVLEYAEVKLSIHRFHWDKINKRRLEGIVISAVDSMVVRKQIFEACKMNTKVKLLIDPRTGPELFRMLTIDPNLGMMCDKYEETLHSDEEAVETACTGRSIIYSVMLVSAFISNQVKRYLMDQDYKIDVLMDMKNSFAYFD